ncbi:hypothetical protein JOF56_008020 [Kibdelosporangium banguiense]|uniref:Glycerophosphoryl diester phosphodiesterase membrane domain-containing protein n=1 Tax=Kibdelosporangium banguiense TaxID=1365924 RepID=A0ABS4TUL2_9PSEU|nr:hypothetical protein [Kibdelosporangium banguiense]MBP2327635.1 hypothetical protein [Kibdelosporangium banguiense]
MSESGGWSAPDDQSDRPQDPAPQQQPYPAAPPPPMYYGPQQAPKPGVIPLRPLGLGEILDGAVTTMRTYPKQMLGISVLISAVTNLLVYGITIFLVTQTTVFTPDFTSGMDQADRDLELLRISLLVSIPGLIIGILAGMILNGLLTVVMGKAVLGQPITVSEAWGHVRPRFGALVAVSLLYTLLVTAGAIVFVIPGVWLYILFSLASTALILEGAPVGRSMTRSRVLMRDAWWRTFGILLLTALLTFLLSLIISLPFSLINGDLSSVTGLDPQYETAYLLTTIGTIITQAITLPLTSGVTTLIYIDRRMRREGMDIELARQAGMTPPQPPPPPYPGGPAPQSW